MTEITLPITAVRNLLLHAQGVLHPPGSTATKEGVLDAIRRMGALQIDTIHVVARSPYMVLFSRLGDYNPAWLDELLAEGRLFEYWSHAACFLPVEDYPLYLPAMDQHAGRYYGPEWQERFSETVARVLGHIRSNGEVRSADFERTGGKGSGWWDWKEEKQVLEYLHTAGVLMIARREKFQRVYNLRERVMPGWDESSGPLSAEEAAEALSIRAVRALGAAPARWVPDYFRQPKRNMPARLEKLVEAGRLERIAVEGWKDPWYVHPDNLSALEWALAGELAPTYTTLLSPFDPLVWDRERARGLFDFDFTLECYVPEPKRRYGYYLLPILHEGALVGRLDAKAHRKDGIFEVRGLYFEPRVHLGEFLITAVADAIKRCAAWHGTPQVEIRRSEPEPAAGAIMQAF